MADDGFRRAQQMYDQQEPPDEEDDRIEVCRICAKPFRKGITIWPHGGGYAHPECVEGLARATATGRLKLYLAHPLEARHRVRAEELDFEKRTGIELVNPFYDTTRDDVKHIDDGLATRWEYDMRRIVDMDLDLIEECDGVLAVLTKDRMVGTIMEIVYAFQSGKRIYIIDQADLARHPWIRYHSMYIYTSWDQFEKSIREVDALRKKEAEE